MKLKTNHPLAKGLVCSYLMNEGGGNKVFDASGNQNHGTFTNSIPWARGGIEPPGDNEHITIPKFIDQDGDWTVFFSFIQDVRQPNAQIKQSHFMSMVDGGSGTGRSILLINDVGADTFKMACYIDGTENESDTVIDVGVPYTCGLTQGGTDFKFFLNGIPDGSFIATATACKEDILIFDRKDGLGTACFDGLCSVFHWYDRQLTEEEMMWLDQDPFGMFESELLPVPLFYDAGIIIPVFIHHQNQLRA